MGFAFPCLLIKGGDSEDGLWLQGFILSCFARGPAPLVVPGAEMLPQVGRTCWVALRSEPARPPAHLSSACRPLGKSQRVPLEGIGLATDGPELSVNTQQYLPKIHRALGGVGVLPAYVWSVGLHTRPQKGPLGTL